MRKVLRTLFWLLLVLFLSAVVLRLVDRKQDRSFKEEETEVPVSTESVMLIGYEGEPFPGIEQSGSYLKVGCRDALIPTEASVSSSRLASILFALTLYEPPQFLHNPMKEKGISIVGVHDEDDGRTYRVSLAGNPELGGLCDLPRLKGQIEETINLHTKRRVILELNGSEKAYRCMGKSKYECK